MHTNWVTTRVWFPWVAGPEEDTDRPVVVSLTDFTMHSLWSLPGIVHRGGRLALGWYGLPGAVGVRLWADPHTRRTGSLSVWTDLAAMRRWVGLPLHVATMRRYRTRGSLSSATWNLDRLDRRSIVAEATRILDGDRRRR